MRFIFLGTGTSSGVPAIGCECAVCMSSNPRDQRLRAGAAVLWTDPLGQERVVLIDATPDLRAQMLRHRIRRCDAILFTHNHVDHTFGLDEVRRFNVLQGGPIDIFAEPHTMDHLKRVYTHIFDKAHNINDSFVASLIPRFLVPGDPVELFGLSFLPIRLLHGNLPIVGFRVEPLARAGGKQPLTSDHFPLAYCTDVSGIPPETYPQLRGLRTLVLDALRRKHHPTHLTLDRACDIAANVGAGSTYFTHIAHDLAHDATNAELPDTMQLAFDGLTLGPQLGSAP